jgi:guanosine-3',5'-bis(diphosphate) 3'-pyrophosphohydrolase
MNATPERILQAQWVDDAGLTHCVDIEVEAADRSQLLQDIMAVFSGLKTQVSSVNARVRKDGVAVASLTVQIRDLDHLHKLLTKLETLKNIRRVYRVTKRERTAL